MLHLKPMIRQNGYWTYEENPTRLFDLTGTRFEHCFNQSGKTEIEDIAEFYSQSVGTSRPTSTPETLPVYRPGVVNWQEMKSLRIHHIKPNNIDEIVFQESHRYEDLNALDPERQMAYQKNLKNEIKRALLADELAFQKSINGYFKPPDMSPMNPFYMVNQHLQHGPWMSDWSWLTDGAVPLADFSVGLIRDTLTETKSWLRYQKERLRFFRDSQKLDCQRVHLDDLGEARRYVKKLKVYAELNGNLFAQTSKALEKAICRLARVQHDLTQLMEKTIDR